jgi:hypothetical protein
MAGAGAEDNAAVDEREDDCGFVIEEEIPVDGRT